MGNDNVPSDSHGHGHLHCWGYNAVGQLGYGHTDTIGDDETPRAAGSVVLGGSAVKVSAGLYHTRVLLGDGAVSCFGYGDQGRRGYANTRNVGDNELPASAGIVDMGGAIDVTAGYALSCPVLEAGFVHCWGDGSLGQIGYGSTVDIGDDETPALGRPLLE